MDTTSTNDLHALLGRISASDRLAHATFQTLPLTGNGSPVISPQARHDPTALSEIGLEELVGSIGTVGQLQPILVATIDTTPHLIAGERRLRAMRLGHKRDPGNQHWQHGIRALVIPGPLDPWELRAVQLAENLARRDLTDTDLARACMYARCELLAERARNAGHSPPGHHHDDPIQRWDQLVEWRDKHQLRHTVNAPWPDVLATLGLPLSESRAKELVMALRRLPVRVSEEMDALGISSRSRILYGRLAGRGQTDAEELLAAVQATGGNHEQAVRLALDNPQMTSDEVATAAQRLGDTAKVATASRTDGMPSPQTTATFDATQAITALRTLNEALRAGQMLSDQDAGSLRLLAAELVSLSEG